MKNFAILSLLLVCLLVVSVTAQPFPNWPNWRLRDPDATSDGTPYAVDENTMNDGASYAVDENARYPRDTPNAVDGKPNAVDGKPNAEGDNIIESIRFDRKFHGNSHVFKPN